MTKTLADLPLTEVTPEVLGELHASLRDMRAKAPMFRSMSGIIVGLHHRHLDYVAGDATRQIETEILALQGITSGPIFEFVEKAMLFSNDETHKRRRAPISRNFAFKLIEEMRPRAAKLAGRLIEERLGAGPIDFAGEIAAQIPARIIAEILGIPESDLPIFMRWIGDAAEAIGFVKPERRQQVEASLVEFYAYIADIFSDRRTRARGDFISNYLSTTARDSNLSEAEILCQIIHLILGGTDTTPGSLCMTFAHLLSRPKQWQAFCENPEILKRNVVDEGLRFDPVSSALPRITRRDIEIDGYLLPGGTPFFVSMLAVLRDPEIYSEPDEFNIRRTDHPKWHPIFGVGAHRCLGEALGRVELEETLTAIARVAPNCELIGDFPCLSPGVIRQVSAMEVSFA